MVYRKGELSGHAVDREWPHQVALRAEQVAGKQYDVVHEFCRELTVCPRGHAVRRGDADYVVFCFAGLGATEIAKSITSLRRASRCWFKHQRSGSVVVDIGSPAPLMGAPVVRLLCDGDG
jgi:hypothetical protein